MKQYIKLLILLNMAFWSALNLMICENKEIVTFLITAKPKVKKEDIETLALIDKLEQKYNG